MLKLKVVISKFNLNFFKGRFSIKVKDLDISNSSNAQLFRERGFIEVDTVKRYKDDEIESQIRDFNIPRYEYELQFSRSSGPGGQHVNKTETKATVRFNIAKSSIINEDTKENLLRVLKNQVNKKGELFLSNQETRDREENTSRVLANLKRLILSNTIVKTKTKVEMLTETLEEKKDRIEYKRNVSRIKQNRRNSKFDQD